MKRNFLNIFNVLLAICLALVLSLYLFAALQNREFSKQVWSAEIQSVADHSADSNRQTLRIIEAFLYNKFNKSEHRLHMDSNTLIVSKTGDSAYFYAQKELLPDSLSLKYFSANDRKFYELKTSLNYSQMKKLVDKKLPTPRIILEIRPKGKVNIKMMQKEDDVKSITTFTAKETTGDIEMLVYEKSLGTKINYFEDIKTVNDFSDLLLKKYYWIVRFELEEGFDLDEASAYSFDKQPTYSDENKVRRDHAVPESFSIKFGNEKKYRVQFTFNPFYTLDSFRKLELLAGNDPIVMTFKLYKDHYTECEISKNGVAYSLKDSYPDLPIHLYD